MCSCDSCKLMCRGLQWHVTAVTCFRHACNGNTRRKGFFFCLPSDIYVWQLQSLDTKSIIWSRKRNKRKGVTRKESSRWRLPAGLIHRRDPPISTLLFFAIVSQSHQRCLYSWFPRHWRASGLGDHTDLLHCGSGASKERGDEKGENEKRKPPAILLSHSRD